MSQSLSPVLELSMQLMREPSVTPYDGACQDILAKRLTALGFDCETLLFGDSQATGRDAQVKNLWAKRHGMPQHDTLQTPNTAEKNLYCALSGIPMSCQQAMKRYGRTHRLSRHCTMAICTDVVRRI